MIYKVVIDATKALDALKKLDVKYNIKKENFLFVDAENPDDACYAAFQKLQDQIIDEKFSEEVVDYLEDELKHVVRVNKLVKVRPYA